MAARAPSRPLRRRDAAHQWSMHFGPNMTPMVDVVIVILIFFMSATALIGPEWFLRASLPAQTGSGSADADPFEMPTATLRVTLEAGAGDTRATGLGLQNATLDELAARLEDLGRSVDAEDAFVLLAPAPDVPYRDVVLARDLCERAGLANVGLGEP